MINNSAIPNTVINIGAPRASDWLWRPWFAKLWWAAIPIYWMGAAVSASSPMLSEFYDSVPAAYLNLVFFPMTALLVLGVGYARAWLDALPAGDDDPAPITDPIFGDENEIWQRRSPGMPDPCFDIYDPRSGGLYIGSPSSLQHPGRR